MARKGISKKAVLASLASPKTPVPLKKGLLNTSPKGYQTTSARLPARRDRDVLYIIPTRIGVP